MIFYLLQLVVGLVGVYIFFSIVRVWRLIKRGKAVAVNAIPFQRLMPGAKERILVAGDSTAVGTGASRPEESTAGRIALDHPRAEVVNMSKNGRLAREMLTELMKPGLGHFDIVIVQIGGNDITYGTDIGELEHTLRGILERAKELGDKVVIMHTGNLGASPLFPYLVGLYFTHRTRLVRAMYMRVAGEYGARYADLFAERKDDIFLSDKKRYYLTDFYHPSSAGYEIWYEAIKKALRKRTV
jgi:lysophospholipase L1-like esterase